MSTSKDEEQVFIVFRGVPEVFRELTSAEEYAEEKTGQDHEYRVIMLVPRERLTGALVAKYHGVALHALSELEDE